MQTHAAIRGEHTENTSNAPLFRAEDLSKHYGQTVALDGVNVTVPHGSIGLLGPNGAGKSTLIRLLLGLTRPTFGHCYTLGLDATNSSVEIGRRIGYMPESDCLPTDTVAFEVVRHLAEVSGLPPSAARIRTADILYLCGLDEERYRPIREFSTGMKQRVKLAQALVHDPDVIFFDEPTNGLDPSGHDDMLELIDTIHHNLGISIVLSSHVLEDVERVCEFVVMVAEGRLIGAERLSSLVTQTDLLSVEIEGDREAFRSHVEGRGIPVDLKEMRIVVELADDSVFDVVRDAAVASGAAVRNMSRRRRSLEDVYIARMDEFDQNPNGAGDV
jgi:ABC-2 type transport system ATP-binding protein